MIYRETYKTIEKALNRQAAVAVLGPRQVGKTTLALEIGKSRPSLYLDLESARDREKIKDIAYFCATNEDKLVILDEIHRAPEIFQELRGIIDEGRRKNLGLGRFLILGSASIELLKQSGESLAGRIEYVNLNPLNLLEIQDPKESLPKLWLRGGFPGSYLATTDEDSFINRLNFIRTYLERDIPTLGPRIPAQTLERFWTMLAHNQGTQLNASKLSMALGVSPPTVTSYLDLLVDLLLVRRLPPYHSNIGKRLVKSPKVYIRDSGLTHALLGIDSHNSLLGHPVAGHSWEGFCIETLLNCAPPRTLSSYYRTAAGSEIDLVLEIGSECIWAIEMKQGFIPKLEKGFYHAREDVQPTHSFIVYGGHERYAKTNEVDVVSLQELSQELYRLR